ncbi:hypothetical protein P9Z84_29635 [Bacillus cereus]|uniref:hypothetical protein n=1 Tax=Bacillus thuringiensis TaxID=1428 RepID=UPI000BF83A6B|nr:hypothetical protein [Bacillus thuringiensis]MEC3196814.1 hypothetical protein [Bacillus cereus]PEV88440.1 hypothetical protein CN442_20805 [Bacillus thuringiensis]PFK91004.1 hypothetical protein COJ04_21660 [Bacillus thuringiensis]
MKVANAFNERRHKLLAEGEIEPKYYAIFELGSIFLAGVVGACDEDKAARFFDNVIGCETDLGKKYGCTAVEITDAKAVEMIGSGARYYDAYTFEKVAK